MSRIEIRFPSQPVETRKLSRSRPLSIGRHASNDICVDDEHIAALHCRISWNRQSYEVSAASKDGVDLNGTIVRQSPLKEGDVLRVGPVDILIHSDEAFFAQDEIEHPPDEAAESEIGLKPVTEDQLRSMRRVGEPAWTAAVGAKVAGTGEPASACGTGAAAETKRSERRGPDPSPKSRKEKEQDSVIDLGDADAAKGIVLSRRRSAEETEAEKVTEEKPLIDRIKLRGQSRSVRPGEEETLRSPFVLGLTASAVFLLLAAAVFYFVISRETAQRAYDAANEQYQQGKFTQSVELFQKFLDGYPRHHLSEDALDYLWKSRIEKDITGAAPSWRRGFTTLTEYMNASHDRPRSESRTADFRVLSERITTGAAESAIANPAASAKPRELLAVSEDARKLVARFSGQDGVPAETAAKLAATIEKAQAAIRKQETFDARVAAIDQALVARKPMEALKARLDLLAEYPAFSTNPKMAALLAKTLETERALVTREELEQEAVKEERPVDVPEPLTFALHTRSRTDEMSSGRTVFALAADCCYGIDSVTGEPVWRRIIGHDAPFFPILASTSVPGLLMFDTRHGELLLVDQRSGRLVWRQPLSEAMSGAPLIHEGQIYAPTLGNHLYKVDLETGRITTKLTFSQQTLSPPVLVSNGERLVVAGDEALFYTLTTRPLECTRVTYTAHNSGAITAPLLAMGSLILVSERIGESGSRLRVLDVRGDDHWLEEVAQAPVAGQLRDAPVIRGKELFVSSSGERITAYTISDDAGQRPLTQVAGVQVQTPHPGPMFLSAGPDGQLWMAGSAVRKLQLKTESIKLEPAEIAAGTTSQPLQNIGQYLYTGRRLPYSAAVLFAQADRESMTGLWRVVLGSRLLAASTQRDGSLLCLSEGGEIYQSTAGEIQQGGFKRAASTQLKIPVELNEPLNAATLSDGRIAAFCGGPKPQLWVVGATGQIERQADLEFPLDTAPVLIAEGIVLPMPGRLRLLRHSDKGAGAKVEDYLSVVEKGQPTHWKSLCALDESDVAAIDNEGRLARVQFRNTPVSHLAEVTVRKLEGSIDVPLALSESSLLLAGADGRVQKLDAATLETESESKLDGPAAGSATVIGGRLFLELSGNRLCCVDVHEECKILWTVPMENSGLSGPPVAFQNRLIVAKLDGEVLALDPSNGQLVGKRHVGQPLCLGPLIADKTLVAPAIDGSLYRIDSILKPQP